MNANNKLYAVLTGDLIASRKSTPTKVDCAMQVLEHAAEKFENSWSAKLRFTRFRGDGWQIVLEEPILVLHAVVHFHATLRASDLGIGTRISAGIGTIEHSGTTNLSDATGNAFFISGDHLETAKKRRFLIAGQGIGVWQNAVFILVEQIIAGWTPAQAEATAMGLLGDLTQEEIAQRIGVTRQAIQSRLASAGAASLDEALYAFTNHDFTRDAGVSHD